MIILEKQVEKILEKIRTQQEVPLRVKLWNGRDFELGANPSVTIHVPKASSLQYFTNPNLMSLGEAYVEGHIDLEGSVHEAFQVAEKFVRTSSLGMLHKLVAHSRKKDKKAIEYHYDVSNDFYQLFLDQKMVYSCAYFNQEEDSLDVAQEQKLDHILKKLQLKPGERFLDIGCGWGALIFQAVEKYGAKAVGITLSQNQYDYVCQKIKEKGLEKQCEVRLQDYRDVPEEGTYDKIASVGMCEHVGLKNLGLYFSNIYRLLTPNGMVLNHGITSVDTESRSVGKGADEFIERYVFPHGELPHISLVLREISMAGFESVDLESLRRHYAKTTQIWATRLEAANAQARQLVGEKRYRIWSVYLAGCAYAFSHHWINIYQVLACKNGNLLPWTRKYMYL